MQGGRKVILVVGSDNYAEPFDYLDEIKSVHGLTNDIWKDPEKISLVMFTGGADVHPSFYGGVDERNWCMTQIGRDRLEKGIFDFCIEHNIKMTGVCRGIQFLNVMAGGFMYQHITRHAGPNHDIYFPYDESIRRVTSTHHQLVGLPNSAIPIAWSHPNRSDIYIGLYGARVEAPKHEIEAAIFPNINAMGVQYHPEMMWEEDPNRIHYGQMITDFVIMGMKEFTDKYTGRAIHGRSRESGSPGGKA
jgi:putative glutamine amidotransferase